MYRVEELVGLLFFCRGSAWSIELGQLILGSQVSGLGFRVWALEFSSLAGFNIQFVPFPGLFGMPGKASECLRACVQLGLGGRRLSAFEDFS